MLIGGSKTLGNVWNVLLVDIIFLKEGVKLTLVYICESAQKAKKIA